MVVVIFFLGIFVVKAGAGAWTGAVDNLTFGRAQPENFITAH